MFKTLLCQHIVRYNLDQKKISKSKIHILPIYGQTDSKPAIVITPHFQSIHRHFEGRHSEVAEKEVKPVPSKDLAPLDVQSFRRPFEGKHSEVAEKEAKPVPSKDLTPPDVQAFFLSCEGSHLEAIKQAVMMELGKDY